MKEAYFDPALQKHKERRALFKKYRSLVIISAASIAGVAALFFGKIYPLI